MKSLRLAILGSTRGTNMLTLIEAIQQHKLAASIEVVISNREDALILNRARDNQIPARYIPGAASREAYDDKLSEALHPFAVELIVLIGYMRILTAPFVANWRQKMINVHPSLLPDFAGKMDTSVHQAVLDAGVSESGCTVHFVTEDIDSGPILLQKRCPVLKNDTALSLKTRVQQLEGEALVEVINSLCLKREEIS